MGSETADTAAKKHAAPPRRRRSASSNGPRKDGASAKVLNAGTGFHDGGADDVGERAAEAVQGGEDLGGLSARDLGTGFGKAVARPGPLTREGARVAVEVAKAAVGRSDVAPAKG